MLFDKTLRQECGRNFGVTLLVSLTIVLTIMLIRTLSFIAGGRVGPGDTLLFLLHSVLAYLPMLATVSLFIAMVAALSRLYRDSEMAVWMSSGVGLWQFIPCMLRFALPAVLGILVVALTLWPWSNQRMYEMRKQFDLRSIFDRIEPGRFQETADGLRVVYIDSAHVPAAAPQEATQAVSSKIPSMARSVFFATFESQSQSVTTAPLAFSENNQGRILIALQRGRQLRQNLASAADPVGHAASLDVIGFEQLEFTIDNSAIKKTHGAQDERPRSINTWGLLQRYRAAPTAEAKAPLGAELFWRMSFALAALNSVFLAVAIVLYNPRMRWSPHLLYAFLALFAYYNGINALENRLLSGKAHLLPATLALHGGVFLLALLWITLRQTPRLWRWLWPIHRVRRRAPLSPKANVSTV